MTAWTDVYNVFHSKLGVKESPANSNHQEFGVWYGMDRVAWCAIYQSWGLYTAFRMRGGTSPLEGVQSAKGAAYCPTIEAWARKQGLWVPNPVNGALALYDFYHVGESHHVSFVYDTLSTASFWSIEGNTSVTSQDNGGEVQQKKRSNVSGYVRGFADLSRFYKAAAPPKPTPHPAAPAWPGRVLTLTSPLTGGSDVKTYQAQMAKRGWRIAVDGVYGPASDAVTRGFQKDKGLVADGDVGPVTWHAAFVLPVT